MRKSGLAVGLAVAILATGCAHHAGRASAGWSAAIRALPEQRVLNVAHRGARSLAPENTLAAGRKAFEVGADAWEIDVQLSRDGQLVIMHDDTLARTTNVESVFPLRAPWYVSDFTLDELRRLDAGSWFAKEDPFGRIAAGEVSAEEEASYKGERIPTLDEALELTRQHGGLIDVEIKQMPRRYGGIAEKVVAAIEAAGMEDSAAISCFDHSIVVEVKRLDRRIGSGPIVSNRIGRPGKYVRHLLGGDAYFPSSDVMGARSIAFAGSQTVKGSNKAADLNVDDLTELRASGVPAFVWTVNEEALMRPLIDAGVTGIITDYPQKLAKMAQWKNPNEAASKP